MLVREFLAHLLRIKESYYIMIKIKRTNSEDKDFQYLASQLDKDLALRNGETNDFFAQYNKSDQIKHTIVAFIENKPAGCGAMKQYDNRIMEIKRMFVPIEMRGKGVAVAILKDLEKWAKEMSFNKCILETGDKMPEAIGLYKKNNYKIIPNYGPYENVKSSICFEKEV